jgi:uridine phosphorylase
MKKAVPLLNHPLGAPSSFSPEALVEAVREERGLKPEPIPLVCVLEFDGDLTDWLVSTGLAKPVKSWACFHTTMFSLDVGGVTCGIVARTIGGPYAVLVAEQMAVSGARIVLGLTSAGRVSQEMPVPGLVAVTAAVRDEGTSYHYLPAGETVAAPKKMARLLELELRKLSLPVRAGTVWTTDAPYRETASQLTGHAARGVLAVEMQAASLFAFSKARRFPVGIVAYVTNGSGQTGAGFDKGPHHLEFEILKQMCLAGGRFVLSSGAPPASSRRLRSSA